MQYRCISYVIQYLKKEFLDSLNMEFINYFDIPREELGDLGIMNYLERLYRRIGAPKGRIRAWYSLPHEDKNIKRICVFYSIDKIEDKPAAR